MGVVARTGRYQIECVTGFKVTLPPLDFILDILAVTGWGLAVFQTVMWYSERRKKRQLETAVKNEKDTALLENIRKGLLALPDLPSMKSEALLTKLPEKYTGLYIQATSINDQERVLDIWESIGKEIGQNIENEIRRNHPSLPSGLAQAVTFLFISHYSVPRSHEYLKLSTFGNPQLETNVARFYHAFSTAPKSLESMLSDFEVCTAEQQSAAIASMRGELLEKVTQLFVSEKWQKRITERLREFVREREMSIDSVINSVIETTPTPQLFLVFKNEGKEDEPEGSESRSGRVLTRRLSELCNEGKAELISYISPIYFIRDPEVISNLTSNLPSGEENNFVVFSARLDPLTMRVRTSDIFHGRPAELYRNLQRFSDTRQLYEALITRIGIRPSDLIETADIGFLLEPKTPAMSNSLRSYSTQILADLRTGTNKNIANLTDLGSLDPNETRYFGSLIADKCKFAQSVGKDIAEKIVSDARLLHESVYESN